MTLKGRNTQRKGNTSEGDRGYPSSAGGSPSSSRATEKTQWKHAVADYASAILTRNFWHMQIMRRWSIYAQSLLTDQQLIIAIEAYALSRYRYEKTQSSKYVAIFWYKKKIGQKLQTRKSKQFPDHSHKSFYSSCIM